MPATLNPALRDFWLTPARNRVLYGGRASSKSWDAAGFAIFLACTTKGRFLCTRHFQNKIADSVYTLLVKQIDRFGLRSQFKILDNSIVCPRTGTDFLFFGRSRNIEEIKGAEGVTVHWAEECHLMTEDQWSNIDPTLRDDGSQHWLVFNPRYASDYVYQNFVLSPPDKTIVRKINYTENPFLSQTMLDLIKDCEKRDPDLYRHIYLGEPLADDDAVLIRRSWINAAVDAHIKLGFPAQGRKVIGFDVADSGNDKCANAYAHGPVIEWLDEWSGGEDRLMQSCSRVFSNARERSAEIVYDSIGVGAGCGSKFEELNDAQGSSVEYEGFNAGGKVWQPDDEYMPGKTNGDHFSNLKAQAWGLLADRFRNTYDAVTTGHQYEPDELISISSDIPMFEKLATELSAPRRDFDRNGKMKVESKEDLAKRGIKSPNLADAVIMCYVPLTTDRWSMFG